MSSFLMPLFAGQQGSVPNSAVGAVFGERPLSPAEIAALEQTVATNPADLNARKQLLTFYASGFKYAGQDNRAARLNQIQYVVQQQPGSNLAGSPLCYIGATGNLASPADHEGLVSLWLTQAYAHFDDAKVVLNALRFLAVENKSEAEELFARATAAHPTDLETVTRFGFFYAAGLTGADTSDGRVLAKLPDSARKAWAEHCRTALDQNSNAYVLMGASIALPNVAMRRTGRGTGFETWVRYSEELRKRAGIIDPNAAGGKTMPVAFGMYAAESQMITNEAAALQAISKALRFSGTASPPELMARTAPVYPPEAIWERIQGTVTMEVTIGTDGSVSAMQLVSGHPLLVPAAQQAIQHWKYKPTLLNGVPSSVRLTVNVPFTLPASGNLP